MDRVITWKSPQKITFLLVSLFLLFGLLIVSLQVNSPVSFLDPNFEQVIRDKIKKPVGTICQNDLVSIIELNASGRDIHRLEGIEALKRLVVLNLADNSVEDMTPLASLSMLKELNLANNQITDLEAVHFDLITHLRLRELNLSDNLISDLKQLADLRELVYLNIHSNPVDMGVKVLGDLEGLETLIMRNVYIGDEYHFLENLTQLQRLNIRNTGIKDVSVISGLMETGALQDKPATGKMASIDMLEIDPEGNGNDPYRTLRRYWDNINYRYPLSLPYYPSSVQPPKFSQKSGFYENNFSLTLTTDEPDSKIFYTLDGSEPSLTPDLDPMSSTYEYFNPIFIQNKGNVENLLCNIKTSPLSDYPNKCPSEDLKANVIRAVVVKFNGERSNVITHSYFINENMKEYYSVPVVSISTNPEYLFDDELGIYVPGEWYEEIDDDRPWWNPANYTQRGEKWERPVYFQMFSQNGEVLVAQNLGIRIHGGATRALAQKSLRLYTKEVYDQQILINYDFFPTLNNRFSDNVVDSFETLILRNSGNDWQSNDRWHSTMFRDAMSQSLLEHTKLDIQGYQPVIVYINGEYWGIHNVRTRYDNYYYYSYYGIETEDLILLEGGSGSLYLGSNGDEKTYTDLLKLLDEHYMKNKYQTSSALIDHNLFEYFTKWIDIENFITYNISEIYLNNTDWGIQNIRFWRKDTNSIVNNDSVKYGHDGKWRWMITDTDFGFVDPQNNTLRYATRSGSANTFLFRALLENKDFKENFINTFADHLNTTFREEVVINQINKFKGLYAPEVQEQINRWGNLGGSFEAWENNVDEMKEFAYIRPTFQCHHIIEYFDLPGSLKLTINTDASQGYIRINSIDIVEGSIGVNDPNNWSGTYFQSVPIEITAVPYSGYEFIGWKGIDNLAPDATVPQITLDLYEDLSITAMFSKEK